MEEFNLFPTKIFKLKLNLDIKPLIKELYKIKHEDPKGAKLSNVIGYQSKMDLIFNPFFSPLIETLSNNISKNINTKIQIDTLWGNISCPYSYNKPHWHLPLEGFSGILYLQVPPNSGDLVIHHPSNINESQSIFPKINDLFLFKSSTTHSVDINLSNQDRISMAFDFKIL